MLVLALSMCFVKSKKIANNGDGLNTNIFTTFLLKKCLFIYTYWHFGSAKKPYLRTKKAPYIGICQFNVLLLSGRPWVRIPPGRPKPRTPGWGALALSFIEGIRTPAGVNWAALRPKSRGHGLRRSAGRIPPPLRGILRARRRGFESRRPPIGGVPWAFFAFVFDAIRFQHSSSNSCILGSAIQINHAWF